MTHADVWLLPILEELKRFYEPQPEPPRDAFGFYLWYVLGQRTVPIKRDAALAALKRIPALTPDSLWKAPRAKLFQAIAQVGPPEERLNAVMSGVEVFRSHRDIEERLRGPLLGARRTTRLLAASLGPVGAQWMLLAVGNHPTLPRHVGVGRIALRLGAVPPLLGAIVPQTQAARIVAITLPRDAQFLKGAMLLLVHHAAVTCTLTEPHCRVCPLAVDCEYAHAVDAV